MNRTNTKEDKTMTKERKEALRIGRKIGAVLGGAVFLIGGIVPGFYFGSFGTLLLLTKLAGGPVEPGILVRMLIVAGTVVGIFSIGAVSIVTGSVLGTALGYVADLFRLPAKEGEEAKVPVK
jgi:hypothetical protein